MLIHSATIRKEIKANHSEIDWDSLEIEFKHEYYSCFFIDHATNKTTGGSYATPFLLECKKDEWLSYNQKLEELANSIDLTYDELYEILDRDKTNQSAVVSRLNKILIYMFSAPRLKKIQTLNNLEVMGGLQLCLTFDQDYINLSDSTKDRYVKSYINLLQTVYHCDIVARKDTGSRNGRIHYHLILNISRLDQSLCKDKTDKISRLDKETNEFVRAYPNGNYGWSYGRVGFAHGKGGSPIIPILSKDGFKSIYSDYEDHLSDYLLSDSLSSEEVISRLIDLEKQFQANANYLYKEVSHTSKTTTRGAIKYSKGLTKAVNVYRKFVKDSAFKSCKPLDLSSTLDFSFTDEEIKTSIKLDSLSLTDSHDKDSDSRSRWFVLSATSKKSGRVFSYRVKGVSIDDVKCQFMTSHPLDYKNYILKIHAVRDDMAKAGLIKFPKHRKKPYKRSSYLNDRDLTNNSDDPKDFYSLEVSNE